MSAFKWFFWLFIAFALSAALCGTSEMSYLGSYSSQAVWAPFFETYGETSADTFGKVTTLFINPATYQALLSMLVWNYATLESGLGLVAKILLLWPLSAAFILAFCYMIAGLFRGTST